MKVYFFPGLGADSSLAPLHILPGHEVQWIEWPKKIGDNWDDFIGEILRENTVDSDAVFAGISFGGLVAQRLSQWIRPKKIIFIGSLQSAGSISLPLRIVSRFIGLIPASFFEIKLAPAWMIRYFFGIDRADDVALFYRMAGNLDGNKVKMLIRLALSEGEFPGAEPLKLSIHGGLDKIIPRKNRRVDVEIKCGGHLISMTHSKQINEAILNWIRE